MIPADSKQPSHTPPRGEPEVLVAARDLAHRTDDVVSLRLWNETEASAKARAERQAKPRNERDRVALYARGPTSFSA
jgi:hypothetical protein